MTIALMAALAVALYLLPLAIALPLLADRWPDRGPARVLDVALVLALDAFAAVKRELAL